MSKYTVLGTPVILEIDVTSQDIESGHRFMPDRCPLGLAVLRAVRQQLGFAAKVSVSVSINLTCITIENLKGYPFPVHAVYKHDRYTRSNLLRLPLMRRPFTARLEQRDTRAVE